MNRKLIVSILAIVLALTMVLSLVLSVIPAASAEEVPAESTMSADCTQMQTVTVL